jgi:uncharacterized membrane protein
VLVLALELLLALVIGPYIARLFGLTIGCVKNVIYRYLPVKVDNIVRSQSKVINLLSLMTGVGRISS